VIQRATASAATVPGVEMGPREVRDLTHRVTETHRGFCPRAELMGVEPERHR